MDAGTQYSHNVISSSKLGPIGPSHSRLTRYSILLATTKVFSCVGLFQSYDVLKLLHIINFVFYFKFGTALLLVFLQKPLSFGKRITMSQWLRILRHAFFSCIISLMWFYGLTLCGPLRTLLIYGHSDLLVTSLLSVLFRSSAGSPAKTRGAVLFFVGVICLLLFDNDDLMAKIAEHRIPFSANLLHSAGVFLLLATLLLRVGYQAASRKLAADVGGAKRLHALSTLLSAAVLSPWVLGLLTQDDQAGDSPSLLTLTGSLLCVIFTVGVLEFYAEALCVAKLEGPPSACLGSVWLISGGLLFAWIWGEPYSHWLSIPMAGGHPSTTEHVLSGGVFVSAACFLIATKLLLSPAQRGQKGNLIGYSAQGVPLYSFSSEGSMQPVLSPARFLRDCLKQVLEECDSRNIFYFLCLNLGFTFVELLYGAWTNSLGLISDGFHMLFDCSALLLGLFASLIARWKPTRSFPYGYSRVEILSGFVNGLFLVVIAAVVFVEAIGRLLDPPEIKTDMLTPVSIGGLLVNLIGVCAFSHAHSHGGHAHSQSHAHDHSHGHSHSQTDHSGVHCDHSAVHSHGDSHTEGHGQGLSTNMRGVFLHILADTLGSVGVIVSSMLIRQFGWFAADPICSIFIAVLIFLSVLPLLRDSSQLLLLRTPQEAEQTLAQGLNKVLGIVGVLSYREAHFWQHSPALMVGTLHVQVMPEAQEQRFIQQVLAIFKECGVTQMTVQVEKEEYLQHMTGLGRIGNEHLVMSTAYDDTSTRMLVM
uniref:proton-coupled zinc antiporter SLC30A5 isoform X2 n=1 Tax=Myxine glutinosa TaxID=7769 RepID=UPI00358E7854